MKWKARNITLSEQLKNPIEKYHTVGTVLKYHTVGTIQKYHTVRTIPKSNVKIVERGQIDTPNTQIHDHSLSLYKHFS